jgi:hypothetical protein
LNLRVWAVFRIRYLLAIGAGSPTSKGSLKVPRDLNSRSAGGIVDWTLTIGVVLFVLGAYGTMGLLGFLQFDHVTLFPHVSLAESQGFLLAVLSCLVAVVGVILVAMRLVA